MNSVACLLNRAKAAGSSCCSFSRAVPTPYQPVRKNRDWLQLKTQGMARRSLNDFAPKRRVIRLDLRGHGLSEDGTWSLDGYVDDLIRVIGHFGLERLYEVTRIAADIVHPMRVGRQVSCGFLQSIPDRR
jgi:hypothetical protein